MSDRITESSSDRRASWLIPLMLALVTLGVYLPTLGNDFVRLDDGKTVYLNRSLNHLDLSSFSSFWTTPQSQLYAPLTYSMYAGVALAARGRTTTTIEGYSTPLFAWPFHLCSVLLHCVAVGVLYAILLRLIQKPWPCAAGALLFALHPVQVESVAWVTAANGLLCGLLCLCAIYCYLRAIAPNEKRQGAWDILATEACAGAMLAKPLGAITPILALLAYALVRPGAASRRRGWGIALVWIGMAIPIAIVARRVQQVPAWWIDVPLWQRPLVAGDTITFYLYKLLWPAHLVPDYARPPSVISQHRAFYFAWIVPAVVALLIGRYAIRKGVDALVIGALWFIAALLPVLGLTPFAFQRLSTAADRYLYLPMAGVALIGAWVLGRLRRGKPATAVFTIAVLSALTVRTVFQIPYWRNSQTLFTHCIEVTGREPGTVEK